ncbi:wnt inhibitory factor 1 [Scaptodrosophila lebanonensis]|uniref:Wnt inhibitory factor 1 n=1 Tax=Drosophila lebanonensis TaxID=7225 RepID=A0A6J2UK51_DROLE|nr:wnt inhibitory factor 1 [Scaptodrosophila lebanonensis]
MLLSSPLLLLFLLLQLRHSSSYELNKPPPFCSPYEMLIVNTHQCVRRCHILCVDGVCFEDGPCPCAEQYMTSFMKGLVCAADCLPGCKEAGGYCAAPDLCVCRKNKRYYFDPVTRLCRRRGPHLLDRCRGRCINGRCSYNGECICAQGYELRTTLRGIVCMPICTFDCGRKAFCFAPNMCACRHKHHHYGWDGKCTKDY